MAETIRTAGSGIPHHGCGKEIAREINGVLHVYCVRKGCKVWVPIEDFLSREQVRKAIDLLLSGQVSPADVIALSDPLAEYRQIEGLFVVGPQELDKLFRIETKGNPLGLSEGWIPEIPSIDSRTDAWIRSCIWRDDPEWDTRIALVLVPPKIGNVPTSLVGQNKLLGIAHDGIHGGIIRKDVLFSDWFVLQNDGWANEPATKGWQWLLIYEHPLWTTGMKRVDQWKVAKEKGMNISSAVQDAWGLNMVRAVYDVSFRFSTYSRTSTVCGGNPLCVGSLGDGVSVDRHWSPSYVDGNIAASVQVVSKL